MDSLNGILSQYESLTLAEKFNFFGSGLNGNLLQFKEIDLRKFLKLVILDDSENTNIRKQAIEIHTECVLLQKLKARYELNILIDDWTETQNTSLEVRRLKDLFLFYEEAPDDIEGIYEVGTESGEAEIQSESYFHLGLISFLRALESSSEDSITPLNNSYEHFINSSEAIENRTDAEFFKNVVSLLIDLINARQGGVESSLRNLTAILWHRRISSMSETINPFHVGFYRILFSLSKIKQLPVSSCLDFRKGFTDLYYYFSEIKNTELKDRLSKSSLHHEFSTYLVSNLIEPYFSVSFSAEKSRIESRLSELDQSAEEYAFLDYLKSIVDHEIVKKKQVKSLFEIN
jgi:hypothetical protein